MVLLGIALLVATLVCTLLYLLTSPLLIQGGGDLLVTYVFFGSFIFSCFVSYPCELDQLFGLGRLFFLRFDGFCPLSFGDV